MIDESTLRFDEAQSQEEKEYIYQVLNPNNPFSAAAEEQIMYSKDLGTMITSENETPRNLFTFIRRSNRSINNLTSLTEANKEKANKSAYEIATTADPSLFLRPQSIRNPLSELVSCNLTYMCENLQLSSSEKEQVIRAIRRLNGDDEDDSDDEEKRNKRAREDEEYM